MTEKTLTDRIDALEMRLTYQDETIETLNNTITAQWKQIDALTRQLAELSERVREAEANRFAASLVMPKKLFLRDIRRLGAPETGHIVKLAGDYEVSKEAAARRYTDLCDHTCAVIFSHRGKLRYSCRTKNFPFIDLRSDQPLPTGSISARVPGEPGSLSEWSETEPETWLGSSARLRGKVLYEQYLDQANGYRLSMLTIDDAPDEDEPDEDAEMEESWAPRFRK